MCNPIGQLFCHVGTFRVLSRSVEYEVFDEFYYTSAK
jgi:hypothetical protein